MGHAKKLDEPDNIESVRLRHYRRVVLITIARDYRGAILFSPIAREVGDISGFVGEIDRAIDESFGLDISYLTAFKDFILLDASHGKHS